MCIPPIIVLEGICCGVGAGVGVGVELLSLSPVIVGSTVSDGGFGGRMAWLAGYHEAVHNRDI